MIRAESDLHVAAPPEEVFDRLVDMRNELHWNPMVIEMEKSTDGTWRAALASTGR